MDPSDSKGISSSVRPKRRVGSEAISPADVLAGFDELNLVSTLQGTQTEPNGCNQRGRYRSPLEFAQCCRHLDEWLENDRDGVQRQTYWWRHGRSTDNQYKWLRQPKPLDPSAHHPTTVPVHSPERDAWLEQKRRGMDQPGSGVPAGDHEFDRAILGLGLFSNLEPFLGRGRQHGV